MQFFDQATPEGRQRMARFGAPKPITERRFFEVLNYDWPEYWQDGVDVRSGESMHDDNLEDWAFGDAEIVMMAEAIGDGTALYVVRVSKAYFEMYFTRSQPLEALRLVRDYMAHAAGSTEGLV